MPRLFEEAFLRKLERLALLSRRAMAGKTQGERRSPRRGQSVEFSDFRPYAPGDDFRRIDWNAYARLERFFIKLFVEEEDLAIHFLIDASHSMDWGQPNKLEYAIRVVGAMGYIALCGLDRISVTALRSRLARVGDALSSLRGKRNALALFDFLLQLQADEAPESLGAVRPINPAVRLKSYAGSQSRPGPLLLVSDLMDEGWKEGVNSLAGRGFEVTVVHLLAPDEANPGEYAEPPLNGDFRLLDSETGAEVDLTADFEMLERYRQGLHSWQEDWRQFCGARGLHYVAMDTSIPLEDLLFASLRNQGVLR